MRPRDRQTANEVCEAIWESVYREIEAIAPEPLALKIADEAKRTVRLRLRQTVFAS